MLNINNKNLCKGCFINIVKNSTACSHCGYKLGEESSMPMVLPIGTILLGKYIIGMVLGKGGFGVTYLAYSIKDKKKVAIKEYLPDTLIHRNTGDTLVSTYQGDKQTAFYIGSEKFYEEAKTIARFNGHPNIINVYEFFYENNTAYFVMEYIEGIDLMKYIAKNGGRISFERTIKLITPIIDALIVIHGVGVLHRDISPDNIYIANDGTVKLLDFGSARQVLGEQSKSLSVVLKPGFAPVEQYQTRGKQGPWTDVYALAATMYYCMTGKVPESAMDRIVEDNLKSLTEQGIQINPQIERILLKALSVIASNRYQSIIELKNELTKPNLIKDKLPQQEGIIVHEQYDRKIVTERQQRRRNGNIVQDIETTSHILPFYGKKKSAKGFQIFGTIIYFIVIIVVLIILFKENFKY